MVGTNSKHSYFFILISFFFLALAVLGFFASFLRGLEEGLTNLPWILHVHALSMMGWLTLVILQALLILKGKLTWHYGLAGAGFVLITIVIVTGLGLSTNSLFLDVPAEVKPIIYRLFGLTITSIIQILVFYLAAMIAVRFSRQAHKRLIIFVSFLILDAAFFRMTWLPGMNGASGPIWPLHLYHLLALTPLFLFDLRTLGKLHPATLYGTLFIVVVKAFSVWIWNSETWLMEAAQMEKSIGSWWTPLY